MTVSELAARANVVPDVVRYYSKIGLLKPHKNRKNGYKQYDSADVAKVIFIRKAKSLGYTLREIKDILSHSSDGKSPCPLVRQIIENRIEEHRQRLDDMLALQARMEEAVKQWQHMPDGIPDGHSVCVLIESFTQDADAIVRERNE
ncbi:MAG: MerR family transcriptional regulator [Gammaproteobacteria bacterium]|nr:MerR family transcriptional regulator [Gammaproteobacteria bacterium]